MSLEFKHRKIVIYVNLNLPRFKIETSWGKPKSNRKICISLTFPSLNNEVLLNSESGVKQNMLTRGSQKEVIFVPLQRD